MTTTQPSSAPELAPFKQIQRFIWSQGEYTDIARDIQPVAEALADALAVEPGAAALDVAAGTGNVAVALARRGAVVTASDLTPRMIELGEARTVAEDLPVRWVEADAEALPFAADSFDAATSAFGSMFAFAAAGEMCRVVRRGGRIAIASWTPESFIGRIARTIAGYLPPPPAAVPEPTEWGVESVVCDRLGHLTRELRCEQRHVVFAHDSVEDMLAFHERANGPLVAARTLLRDRYPELREDLLELIDGCNEAADGAVSIRAAYLLATATV